MKVKRYEGKSEQEIMLRVRDELGPDAVILSIKRKPYGGLFALFRKPKFVVQAAFEEKTSAEKLSEENKPGPVKNPIARVFARPAPPPAAPEEEAPPPTEKLVRDVRLTDQQQRIASLENKLTMTEELLSKVVSQLNVAEQMARDPSKRRFTHTMVQVFYESLLEQGIANEVAEALLGDLDAIDEPDKVNISLIVKVVYNNIIDVLTGSVLIDTKPAKGQRQVVAFMGPTGVGKTTTIAKLSSFLMLAYNLRVGLITADTYRIAAVEQIKTYADILGLDVQVVYGQEDMAQCSELLQRINDIILVDTAGRSHRNKESLIELQGLLTCVPEAKRYLVLSVTTRYEDLLQIVSTYAAVTDFDLIFTKLDEAVNLGALLNVCYLTGKKVAYVTFGQNVPDDMEVAKPDKIAKSLLGLVSDSSLPYAQEGGLV